MHTVTGEILFPLSPFSEGKHENLIPGGIFSRIPLAISC